jgi:UDP-N-acetylmuramoyl-L-alanine---L-glutamate ligase
MTDLLRSELTGKHVLLLGFGREGQSSFSFIRKILPEFPLTIADQSDEIRNHALVKEDLTVTFRTGAVYLEGLDAFDLIIKSPGITLKDLPYPVDPIKITSQTDLFLLSFSGQVIGITGTKGKSTTSSLLHYILRKAGRDSILLGNIGRPAFNALDEIHPDTMIVYEMSSHQLEYFTNAPHISILLNLYQEHLDAYHSFRDYQMAKMNIMRFQSEEDYFIYNADDSLITGLVAELQLIRNYLPFSFSDELADGSFIRDGMIFFSEECRSNPVLDLNKKRKLKGDHNVLNIMAVINACKILGIEDEVIREGIAGFTGLEHRIEFAGKFHGILFYNDSIATIPEATMEAVKALETVDTIILGGFDRGIEYKSLAKFLARSEIRNFICTGEAGHRIMDHLDSIKKVEQKIFPINRFDDFLEIAIRNTLPGRICLLSPAAASYDEFMNFEMRGKRFKELVSNYSE